VKEVMNVRFRKTWDISALEKEQLASQEEPCCMDLFFKLICQAFNQSVKFLLF
jgi:hypothetical protein